MFDAVRFLRLATAHWAEHRREYLWFIGIGIMLHFVLLLIGLASGPSIVSTDGQGFVYAAGLYLTAPIFAARYFQDMSRRESGLLVLMRPASMFEKWLLAFLVVAIGYPVAYTLAFYVCDLPGWLLGSAQARAAALEAAREAAQSGSGRLAPFDPERYRLFFVLRDVERWQALLQGALVVTTLQAFAVLGSLWFRAMPSIKTVLAAFLLLLGTILVLTASDGDMGLVFNYWHEEQTVTPLQRAFFVAMWAGTPLFLWMASYFALQERELY